jgi:hypothetical protein
MANNQTGAASLPPLTADGINRLSAQLDTDLAAVPMGAAQRQSIVNLINQIKPQLAGAATAPNLASWMQVNHAQPSSIKALFDELAPLLKGALGVQTGACVYVGGCIQTTPAECKVLGGNFKADKPCPQQN